MKISAVVILSLTLVACATGPVTTRNEQLFRDALFAPASERISGDDVCALSDDMKQFLGAQFANSLRSKDKERALVDALYSKHQLKLAYDAEMTRNAAQTF